MPGEVIPHRVWKNADGRTASTRGAVPYVNSAESEGWTIEESGFTIRHPDGTTGLGRQPFASRAEAQAWVDAHPNFPGMSQG
jgi:hypothetical protein